MATDPPILAAQNLSAGYGSIPILHNIDLFVAPGEIVALLGPNGAGKSTTLLSLSGDLKPMSGNVLWKGEKLNSPPHQRMRNGMSFITEERGIFAKLTTGENLRLGRGGVESAIEFMPELRPLLNRRAGLLSGGEQQMLVLGRALATRPQVLLADELSLGLAPLIVRRLLTVLRRAADEQRVGVLLVEQHVREALRFADRGYVLQRGRVALEGTCDDLHARLAEIEDTYLSISDPADVVPNDKRRVLPSD